MILSDEIRKEIKDNHNPDPYDSSCIDCKTNYLEKILPKIEQQEKLIKEMFQLINEGVFHYLDQRIKRKIILEKAKEFMKEEK